MEREKVSLATLNGGAAIERFDIALEEVIRNITDINTAPKKERSVTIKMTIKPNEARQMGSVRIEVTSKLAPVAPFGLDLFLGLDDKGRGMALEANANQMSLFQTPPDDEKGNVRRLNGGDK